MAECLGFTTTDLPFGGISVHHPEYEGMIFQKAPETNHSWGSSNIAIITHTFFPFKNNRPVAIFGKPEEPTLSARSQHPEVPVEARAVIFASW